MVLWTFGRPGQLDDKNHGLVYGVCRQYVEMNIVGQIAVFTKEGCFLVYRTWDRRKCSLFTVEGCSPKTNRAISPIVKHTEKMGPGKSVHYKGGVH